VVCDIQARAATWTAFSRHGQATTATMKICINSSKALMCGVAAQASLDHDSPKDGSVCDRPREA